jgi:3'-5' exoribonuclease
LAPAAKSLHHACIGGLLEHVMSLCHGALALAPNYPEVDAELLLTGVMLHDIGKIRELNYARSFSYSTEGQLLGHIIIELELLRDKCREVEGFPADLRMLIEHMMISHHGHYEFGSPKLPMFAEALLLHYLDDMDSKMAAMRSQVARDAEMDSVWTSYNPALSRTVLNVQKYLKK